MFATSTLLLITVLQPAPSPAPSAPQPASPPSPASEPARSPAPASDPAPAPPPAPAAVGPTPSAQPPSPLLPPGEHELLQPHEAAVEKARWVPGKGFEIATRDGRFSLTTRARVQLQYAYRHDDDAAALPSGRSGVDQQTMSVRRARLVLSGNVFHKNVKYYFQFHFGPHDMNLSGSGIANTVVRDVVINFDRLRDLNILVGQMKVPYNRERVNSSGDLQLVDRSETNLEFNLDRDLGAQIRSKDFLGLGKLAYYAGVFMGEGRDAFSFTDTRMLYVARLEVLPFGTFDDYQQADLERQKRPRMSIGTSYAYHDEAKRDRGIIGTFPTDGGTTDYHNAQADVVFKYAGLSVHGEFFWRDGKRNPGIAIDEAGTPLAVTRARDGLGWFAQAGYLIPRVPVEIAFRYAQARPLGEHSGTPELDEATPGVNWYLARHPLKLQLDYSRVAIDKDMADGFDRVRLQLQASF